MPVLEGSLEVGKPVRSLAIKQIQEYEGILRMGRKGAGGRSPKKR